VCHVVRTVKIFIKIKARLGPMSLSEIHWSSSQINNGDTFIASTVRYIVMSIFEWFWPHTQIKCGV
jgi:hypothetical protein